MIIQDWLAQVSTYAGSIDDLFALIGVLVGFWFIVSEGVFFWLLYRFRAKDGVKAEYITGEEKHQKRWVSWPHYLVLICDIFIIYGAVTVWYDIKQDLPSPDATIRVIGQQWAWSFVQPGADGELGTADDIATVDELYVESGKLYHYQLEARDVMHDFSVPVFRLKQDAIPGRVITGWFEPTTPGSYDIQCAEICGIGHGVMAGTVIVQTPEEHKAWMMANTPQVRDSISIAANTAR
ncbi:cytochrome C oxidase subunit II [Myxococcota bacterium]|nr:cytochrome C oxidase subunit II [Myxococcota bacterium]